MTRTPNSSRRRSDEHGFTLIELMIVILVLGILAAIIIFAVGPFQNSATTAKNKAQSDACSTASGAYTAASAGGNTAPLSSYFNGTC